MNPQARPSAAGAKPRSVALRWLAGYLALSAVPLIAGGRYGLVVVHLVLIVIALGLCRPEGNAARVLGDLLPLVVAPLLYGELPALIAALAPGGAPSYHDAIVQRWEFAVFGGEPARSLAVRLPVLGVSEVLHAGYLAYYAVIFLPPLVLFARSERRGLGETVAALTITATVCWAIFAFLPVEGPRYLWGASLSVPDGPVRRFTLALLAAGSSRGAAFPSSHMAIATVQTVMAFRWQPRLAWALAPITVLIGVGAVYGGFHYGIDILAGAALGAGIGGGMAAWFGPRRSSPAM